MYCLLCYIEISHIKKDLFKCLTLFPVLYFMQISSLYFFQPHAKEKCIYLAIILEILIKKAWFYFYEPTYDVYLNKETLCIGLINKYNMR